MAYIHECDFCGKRFPNGVVLNVVSFFKATEARYETRGIYEEEFRRIPAGLSAADPRYEVCNKCFDMLKSKCEVLANVNANSVMKEILDFERGENEH